MALLSELRREDDSGWCGMKNIDRMDMIKLGVKDLEEAVCAYEYARKKHPNTRDYLLELPNYHTRESIYSRIGQLRQDLLQLGKEFERGHN